MKQKQVQTGDQVRMHYTGRLTNGAVFGTSEGGEPVEFTAGNNRQMPEAINQAVLGMQPGERKTVTVPPEQGFGLRNPNLEQQVPRSVLPDDVKVGDRLIAEAGGREIPVWVREVGDDSVLIDANHPLAGQTLIFDIELVSIGSEE